MQTTLTDGRITLRPFSPADAPADAPALLEVARESCEEIGRWMPWSDSVTDLDGADYRVERGDICAANLELHPLILERLQAAG